MVTLDSTQTSLPTRDHPRLTLRVLWPLSAPAVRQHLSSQPILVTQPTEHRTSQVVAGLWQALRSVGWVVGFLLQLYVLYVVAHGLEALLGLVRWRPYRVWARRVRFALRDLEIRGVQRFRSDTPS